MRILKTRACIIIPSFNLTLQLDYSGMAMAWYYYTEPSTEKACPFFSKYSMIHSTTEAPITLLLTVSLKKYFNETSFSYIS